MIFKLFQSRIMKSKLVLFHKDVMLTYLSVMDTNIYLSGMHTSIGRTTN